MKSKLVIRLGKWTRQLISHIPTAIEATGLLGGAERECENGRREKRLEEENE